MRLYTLAPDSSCHELIAPDKWDSVDTLVMNFDELIREQHRFSLRTPRLALRVIPQDVDFSAISSCWKILYLGSIHAFDMYARGSLFRLMRKSEIIMVYFTECRVMKVSNTYYFYFFMADVIDFPRVRKAINESDSGFVNCDYLLEDSDECANDSQSRVSLHRHNWMRLCAILARF